MPAASGTAVGIGFAFAGVGPVAASRSFQAPTRRANRGPACDLPTRPRPVQRSAQSFVHASAVQVARRFSACRPTGRAAPAGEARFQHSCGPTRTQPEFYCSQGTSSSEPGPSVSIPAFEATTTPAGLGPGASRSDAPADQLDGTSGGSGGRAGSGGSGGGSGGGGWEGRGGDEEPDADRSLTAMETNDQRAIPEVLHEILQNYGITEQQLPPEIRTALEHGLLAPAILLRYLDATKKPLEGFLMRLGAGVRARILADPKFLFKVAVEEAIGVAGKLSAEVNKRKDRIWEELDFVMANVIMAILADLALVWVPAPVIRFGGPPSASPSKLKRILDSLPSSCLQKPTPGHHYTLAQRVGAYFFKSGQLFCVGFMSSTTGTSLTHAALFIRRALDPNHTPTAEPAPILKTSLLYGTFMSSSSNTRYQLLNGVEQYIVDPMLHNLPNVSKVATFLLRFGNTFWGSSQWVDFTRLMGVGSHQKQKKEEK